MSVLRSPGIEATYLRIIDETIANSSSFQSPAVLEQLKQRWIEKLQARLHSRTAQSSTAVPVYSLALPSTPSTTYSVIAQPASDPTLSSVRDGGTPLATSAVAVNAIPTVPNELQNADFSHDRATTEGTDSLRGTSSDARTSIAVKEAVKSAGVQNTGALLGSETPVRMRNDAVKDKQEIVSEPTAFEEKQPYNGEVNAAAPEGEEDDDWDSAEWEPAGGAVKAETKAHSPDHNERPLTDSGPTQNVAEEKPKAKKSSCPRVPECIGEKRRGIIVECQADLCDDEEDIVEEDLSDLEDHDPVYSDIVVAQFESVQRPHARKPCQKGQWRVKLRQGILQIDGQEILFNTLTGDLNF